MAVPPQLQEKLKFGGWKFDDLPADLNAPNWNYVETDCGLTKQELSRLMNIRCPAGTTIKVLSVLIICNCYRLIIFSFVLGSGWDDYHGRVLPVIFVLL